MPEVKTIAQRLPLIRAGKVNDHCGAAANGAAGAGVKVVCCGCIADVQIKMRVCVDEAGEQQLAADIDDCGTVRGEIFPDCGNFLTADQYVCDTGTGSGYNGTALE